MKLEYKDYILEIEEIRADKDTLITAECKNIGFKISTWGGYDYVIDSFKKNVEYYIKEKEREELQSEISFGYKSFTARVGWDSVLGSWYTTWIHGKNYFNILTKEPYTLTGRYIQELQAKFEDYIDNYLKERNK